MGRGDAELDAAARHLEELGGKLKAPRAAKRKVRKAGGVEALITPAQRQWAKSAAARLERGESIVANKASKGAKVLKGQRRGVGRRPW